MNLLVTWILRIRVEIHYKYIYNLRLSLVYFVCDVFALSLLCASLPGVDTSGPEIKAARKRPVELIFHYSHFAPTRQKPDTFRYFSPL